MNPSATPPDWRLIGLWLVASLLALFTCTLNLDAARLGTEYLPMGNDSFYHARRIIDAATDATPFYQFDPNIHWPEGSMLTWPWGYDYALSLVVRMGLWLGVADPMKVLAWIPTAAVFFSMGLLILIGRLLRLNGSLMAIAGASFALAPTTQLLHGVGAVDHHFAELMSSLAALATGLYWLARPESAKRSTLAGLVLGLTPAIHNGLFVLQVPILIIASLRWWEEGPLPRRASAAFGVAIAASAAAISIPSLPIREGLFEFYTLSWFHLYVACGTGISIVVISRAPRSWRGGALISLCATLMLAPIVSQMAVAKPFLAASATLLQSISETASPITLAATSPGAALITRFYTLLIWLAPIIGAVCVINAWRERTKQTAFLWIFCLWALAFLLAQMRFASFGVFALYLPLLLLVQRLIDEHPDKRRTIVLSLSVFMIVAYLPSLRHQTFVPMPRANDIAFTELRPILATLRNECERDPRAVLADSNAGHYVRYYTRCPVIANNFLLTPQHGEKIAEIDRLFSLEASALPSATPAIGYVLARPLRFARSADGRVRYEYFSSGSIPLTRALLHADRAPAGLVLLDEVRLPALDGLPYAKLYRVQPVGR